MASIDKRGDSYRIRVSRGYDAAGKRLPPFVMEWKIPDGMSEKRAEKEVKKQAAIFEVQCKQGLTGDGKQKFSVYADYVLQSKTQAGELRIHTLTRYKSLLERINQGIGHMKLCDIRPQHLNQLYQELSQEGIRKSNQKGVLLESIDLKALIKSKGHASVERFMKENGIGLSSYRTMMHHEPVMLKTAQKLADLMHTDLKKMFEIQSDMRPLSPKTVLEHHRLIHLVLRQAEKELLIPFNPADRATPPKATRAKVQYFEKEQVAAILDAADKEPLKWKTMLHLLIATGGRRSEVLGLKWENIDFAFNRAHIVQTVGYERGYGIFVDTTKNETSVRWIKLPPETMELLKEYRDSYYEPLRIAAGDAWEGEGFLFVQDSGKHMGKSMHPDSVTSYCDKFSDKYNLPHINPHAFRHTQASLLLFAGLDLITVSRHLGHAKPSTTSDLYAHVMQEAESRVAEAMGSILFSTRKQLPKSDEEQDKQPADIAG